MCSRAEVVEVLLVMDRIIVRTRAETRLKAYSINASSFEGQSMGSLPAILSKRARYRPVEQRVSVMPRNSLFY